MLLELDFRREQEFGRDRVAVDAEHLWGVRARTYPRFVCETEVGTRILHVDHSVDDVVGLRLPGLGFPRHLCGLDLLRG